MIPTDYLPVERPTSAPTITDQDFLAMLLDPTMTVNEAIALSQGLQASSGRPRVVADFAPPFPTDTRR